jgi:hypothetical protein
MQRVAEDAEPVGWPVARCPAAAPGEHTSHESIGANIHVLDVHFFQQCCI